MIGHAQLVLWSRYSDIISVLTITVRGVSNKHCLLPFFIFSDFMCFDMSLLLLTFTLLGVSNKHCSLPLFSFCLFLHKNLCCGCTHNIGFYEDLTKIIFELSSNTHLISSADNVKVGLEGVQIMGVFS